MRKKRNNELLRTQRLVQAQCRNMCIVYLAGITHDEPVFFNMRSCNQIVVNNGVKWALMEFSHKWTVSMAVFYRTKQGENKASSMIVGAHGKYANAANDLGTAHAEYLDSLDVANDFLTAGWIASPVCREIPQEIEERIFTKLGAFSEFLAPHEHRENL